ncbi:ABC transporter permease [Tissierella creatinini]|nr:ABC transporter permease [Tissierella creatinini]TJX64161.1 ABC transporter permease [Soehngenia saccharolytica]
MRLAFSIALRFLKSGKGQTILIALGISVGVAVQIFIGSLIQGLQISLINTTIGSSSHITITSENDSKTIKNWERTMYESAISSPNITYISPSIDGPASINYDNESASVLIRGFLLEDGDKIYKFKDNLYEGRFPAKTGEAMIGKDLAIKSNTRVDDDISLITTSGRVYRIKITGLFDLGVSSVNDSWIVTDLETAGDILSIDGISSVEMQVDEVFAADSIAKDVQYTVSGEDLKVDNWKDLNASLLSGLNGQSVSSYMIQVFVLVSVLLGISSVLAISVVQRSKQIGILKAMGIKDKDASLIFVFQGLMLGVLGAILGVGLGIGLLKMFTTFALNPDGKPVVPIYLNGGFVGLSGLFAVLTSSIASLIPARITSRLNPIEVIKNG